MQMGSEVTQRESKPWYIKIKNIANNISKAAARFIKFLTRDPIKSSHPKIWLGVVIFLSLLSVAAIMAFAPYIAFLPAAVYTLSLTVKLLIFVTGVLMQQAGIAALFRKVLGKSIIQTAAAMISGFVLTWYLSLLVFPLFSLVHFGVTNFLPTLYLRIASAALLVLSAAVYVINHFKNKRTKNEQGIEVRYRIQSIRTDSTSGFNPILASNAGNVPNVSGVPNANSAPVPVPVASNASSTPNEVKSSPGHIAQSLQDNLVDGEPFKVGYIYYDASSGGWSWLTDSSEVTITPKINAQTGEIHGDPVQVYIGTTPRQKEKEKWNKCKLNNLKKLEDAKKQDVDDECRNGKKILLLLQREKSDEVYQCFFDPSKHFFIGENRVYVADRSKQLSKPSPSPLQQTNSIPAGSTGASPFTTWPQPQL